MTLPSPLTILMNAALAATPSGAEAGRGSEASFWFPPGRSTWAPMNDFLFNLITWICIFFFVLIIALMAFIVVKYRRRSNHEKARSDVTHNTPLELAWTILPLLLVIVIFYVGMESYLNVRTPPAGAYEIDVKAQKWSWTFEHPRYGASQANVLMVPVGVPVKLNMESADVLHACYIPAFRVKQDVVPGRKTYLWFECTEPGSYELFCAEYCGKDHSQMHATVQAYAWDEFERRIIEEANVYKILPADKLAEYAMDKIYPRCASCHTLDGKPGTGPTWKGLWEKLDKGNELFTDGTKLADIMGHGKQFESVDDYITKSILDPQQKIVQTYTGAMPTFKGQLAPKQIQAIIYALQELDRFDDKGKLKPGAPPSKFQGSPGPSQPASQPAATAAGGAK